MRATRYLLVLLLACEVPCSAQDALGELADGTLIDRSGSVSAGVFLAPDAEGDGAVRIRGDQVTVDFGGATLAGSPEGADPDSFAGIGVIVENARKVVIQRLRVRGYKVGILVRNCPEVVIEHCDVSGNWQRHLLSTPEAEDASDWLYPHENDADEWLRYGAGIYLSRCPGFTVRNCFARHGQNGLCITRSDGGRVYDNDMSFMSGWGLALYRSSRNTIASNSFDWCIRGYSHGVYNRGQDSAGILLFEQCSENVIAFNSATHGGDGFFLYAGNETLEETGEGGCNDNLVYGNDFSHASNNGIEATFSRGNTFRDNRIDQADHGIWAGYSYRSSFIGNEIRNCNHGISIEHGSDNLISANRFEDDRIAINLWENDSSPFAEKVYGKHAPTRSAGYAIHHNLVRRSETALRLRRTTDVTIAGNVLDATGTAIAATASSGRVDGNDLAGVLQIEDSTLVFGINHWAAGDGHPGTAAAAPYGPPPPPPSPPELALPGTRNAFLARGRPRGLERIVITPSGPYDWSAPLLLPETLTASGPKTVRVLGPRGSWSIEDVQGPIEVTPRSGTLPGSFQVVPNGSGMFRVSVAAPDREEPLVIEGLALAAEWTVAFYRWEPQGAGRPPADWAKVLASEPLATRSTRELDFRWGSGAPCEPVPADHFATVATCTLEVPAGRWRLSTVSDDGIRVFVDGEPVIEDWTWHAPREGRAELTLKAGPHAIRVEHFEIDGHARLTLRLEPVP